VISTPIGTDMVTNMYYKESEIMGEPHKLRKMEYDVIVRID